MAAPSTQPCGAARRSHAPGPCSPDKLAGHFPRRSVKQPPQSPSTRSDSRYIATANGHKSVEAIVARPKRSAGKPHERQLQTCHYVSATVAPVFRRADDGLHGISNIFSSLADMRDQFVFSKVSTLSPPMVRTGLILTGRIFAVAGCRRRVCFGWPAVHASHWMCSIDRLSQRSPVALQLNVWPLGRNLFKHCGQPELHRSRRSRRLGNRHGQH